MRHLDRLEEYLVALLLAAMVALNFGNVLSRYVLNASWSFTGELLLIMFLWVVFLASAIVYKRSDHLGLPLLVDSVSPRWRIMLVGVSGLMSTLLVAFLAFSGYKMVSQQIEFDQKTSVLELPEWVAGLSIPVGALFILARAAQSTVWDISALTSSGKAS